MNIPLPKTVNEKQNVSNLKKREDNVECNTQLEKMESFFTI